MIARNSRRPSSRGEPRTLTQALAWPRLICDLPPAKTAWPVAAVCNACAELALRAAAAALTTDQADGQVKVEKVGPIETEYFAGGNGGQVRYTVVDDLLRLYLRAGGSRLAVRLERAQ